MSHVVVKATPDQGFNTLRIIAGKLSKELKQGDSYEFDWDTTQEDQNRVTPIHIYAVDKGGLTVASVTKDVWVKLQNQKPTLEITSPKDGDIVQKTVAINLDTRNVLMDEIEIHLPGGETAYPMKRLPYVWNWDSTQTQNGDCSIEAVVKDKAGNQKSTKIHLKVQN